MVLGLGGRSAGSDRGLADKGVFAEVEGNSYVVPRREANIRAVYQSGEYVGIQ